MENEIDIQDEIKLRLTPMAENHLLTTTRWVKFLAIVGFVVTALLVVIAFSIGIILSLVPDMGFGAAGGLAVGFLSAFFILQAVLNFTLAFYMYSFSTKTQRGLKMREEYDLEAGFKALKTFFIIIGVMTVIIISLYALLFIITMTAAATGGL